MKKLMTNIDVQSYEFLDGICDKQKRTKRAVIEDALLVYKSLLEKKELEKAYAGMKNDSEYLDEMVGMDDLLGVL